MTCRARSGKEIAHQGQIAQFVAKLGMVATAKRTETGWILNGSLHNDSGVLKRYAPDLMKQGFYRWLNRFHWLPAMVLGFALLATGGWSWVLWGHWLARDLAGEFGDPYLGLATV